IRADQCPGAGSPQLRRQHAELSGRCATLWQVSCQGGDPDGWLPDLSGVWREQMWVVFLLRLLGTAETLRQLTSPVSLKRPGRPRLAPVSAAPDKPCAGGGGGWPGGAGLLSRRRQ